MSKGLKVRADISEEYKWKLSDIYESKELWEKDFKKVNDMANNITKYSGILSESSNNLLKCLNDYVDLMKVADTIYVYSRMKRDEDNEVSDSQGMANRAVSLLTRVSEAVSYISPEISSMDK